MSLSLPTLAAVADTFRAVLSQCRAAQRPSWGCPQTEHSSHTAKPGQPGEEPLQPQKWQQVSNPNLSTTGHRAVPHNGKPAAAGATLIMKVGLSTTNYFLSPDLSSEGCKSRRKPQVGACSVATYSWAGWCRHLWLAEQQERQGGSHSASLESGRQCWHREGLAGNPGGYSHLSCQRIQLQAREAGSTG